jgi:hypothetical protein
MNRHRFIITIPEFFEQLHLMRDMNMLCNRFVTTLTACCLALVLTQSRAEAQVKPFKITGEGVGPAGLPPAGQPPRRHWIVGEATHLGRHYGEGTVQTDSFGPEFDDQGNLVAFTGEFGSGSPFVFTGAHDDDSLVTWYGRTDHGASEPGTYRLTILGTTPDGAFIVEAAWIAEFVAVPDQSTGKFAGVSGSWIMYAFSEPFVLGSADPVVYWWQGEGTLTFRQGK